MKINYLLILGLLAGCNVKAPVNIEITVEAEKHDTKIIVIEPDSVPAPKLTLKTIPCADSYPDKIRYRREPEEEDDFLKHINESNYVQFDEYIIHIVGTWEPDGACLWNIALEYYDNPNYYITLYQANSEIIESMDLIYPKQKLRIPLIKQ